MKFLSALLVSTALLTASAQAEPKEFSFDAAHTNIIWGVSHAGFSNFVGEFRDFDGKVMLDEQNPTKSSVKVTIKTGSARSDSDHLDEKLKTDFFNTAKFPDATFESTKVTKTGEKTAKMEGNLTLLGVTKPVTLDVTLNKIGLDKWQNKHKAGFHATTTIKRSDFGMNYLVPDVGDDVTITIDTEIMREREKTDVEE
ncbi:MAG: YceI family protein [Rickettsiales bacterium]